MTELRPVASNQSNVLTMIKSYWTFSSGATYDRTIIGSQEIAVDRSKNSRRLALPLLFHLIFLEGFDQFGFIFFGGNEAHNEGFGFKRREDAFGRGC